MRHVLKLLTASAAALALTLGVSTIGASDAMAQKGGGTPKPTVDCSKKANQKLKACQHKEDLSDDQLFNAAYWLSRKGEYAMALDFLSHVRNKEDARVLTYIGFATRKLGDVETSMGYYQRALASDANYTIARAYMGEAFLQKGDRAAALEQLGEIANRCGMSCDEYKELSDALAKS